MIFLPMRSRRSTVSGEYSGVWDRRLMATGYREITDLVVFIELIALGWHCPFRIDLQEGEERGFPARVGDMHT